MMTIREMIAEWRKGCSCAGPDHDRAFRLPEGSTSPVECADCTEALINAIEDRIARDERERMDQDGFEHEALEAAAAHLIADGEGWQKAADACQHDGIRQYLAESARIRADTAQRLREIDHNRTAKTFGDLPLGQEVIDLVIAARELAFSDHRPVGSPETQAEIELIELFANLDKATEAFAAIVPWDDEPIDLADNPARVLRRMAEQAGMQLSPGQISALDAWEFYLEQPVRIVPYRPSDGENVVTLDFPGVTSREQAERLADHHFAQADEGSPMPMVHGKIERQDDGSSKVVQSEFSDGATTFDIETVDPRFNPDLPVRINGIAFVRQS
jgi:hypothetical protein